MSVKSAKSVKKTKGLPEKKDAAYAFPSKVRCPRCGSLQTRRTGEYQGVQYRECMMPVCRKKFSVHGEKV
jgi:ssDNA-binding Zn-finger/Zn-ribbon topoisomerase 1